MQTVDAFLIDLRAGPVKLPADRAFTRTVMGSNFTRQYDKIVENLKKIWSYWLNNTC